VSVRRAARAVTALAVTALLAGCAGEPSAWTHNQQDDCERRGGVWRTTLGFCEFQSGGAGSM